MEFPAIDILVVNCHGLKNKVDDFTDLLLTTKPTIVIGTESWLDEAVYNAEVFPSGFVVCHCDRNTHGGGVFLLIRETLHSVPLDFRQFDFESVWCTVSVGNGEFLFVGSFYRLPSMLLFEAMSSVPFDDLVLRGGFNHPDVK